MLQMYAHQQSKCPLTGYINILKKKNKNHKSQKKKRQEINLGDMQTENKTQHNTKSITPLIRNEIFILVLSWVIMLKKTVLRVYNFNVSLSIFWFWSATTVKWN